MNQQADASDQSSLLVRKTIVVNAPAMHAFEVFTHRIGRWWPLATHRIGTQPPVTAVIEPRAGGRWFECASDGTECDWGTVKVWDPPARLVLSWSITADWRFDATLDTEVEVRFISEAVDRTRIELEHRHLDRYADEALMMKGVFDSENGWAGLLAEYARHLKHEE